MRDKHADYFEEFSLLTQELEPAVYSMEFGDSRMLEARPPSAMARHAWRDAMLPGLAAYVRPPELNLPEAQLSADAQKAAQQQVRSLVKLACCYQCICPACSTQKHGCKS